MSNSELIQQIVSMVARAANQAGLHGQKIDGAIWLAPTSATSDPKGAFVLLPNPRGNMP